MGGRLPTSHRQVLFPGQAQGAIQPSSVPAKWIRSQVGSLLAITRGCGLGSSLVSVAA